MSGRFTKIAPESLKKSVHRPWARGFDGDFQRMGQAYLRRVERASKELSTKTRRKNARRPRQGPGWRERLWLKLRSIGRESLREILEESTPPTTPAGAAPARHHRPQICAMPVSRERVTGPSAGASERAFADSALTNSFCELERDSNCELCQQHDATSLDDDALENSLFGESAIFEWTTPTEVPKRVTPSPLENSLILELEGPDELW